jgi:hypothetical protein
VSVPPEGWLVRFAEDVAMKQHKATDVKMIDSPADIDTQKRRIDKAWP